MNALGLGIVLALIGSAGHAAAQPAGKVARIGVISFVSQPEYEEEFRRGLRELGWMEGQNLVIEYGTAEGNRDRLPDLADDLVRRKVDVIVAFHTPAAQAAKRATRTIPIVFAAVADPIAAGLVTNLGRPSENLTGIATINVELSAKRLELLREATAGATRVAVLVNPAGPQAVSALKEAESAARALGLELRVMEVRAPEQFERSFAAMVSAGAKAVYVLPDPMFGTPGVGRQLGTLALKARLPMMTPYRNITEAGALLSYGPSEVGHRRAATYVDRILKGISPAALPVEQPTMFELTINLKTAKALGLTMPQSLLFRADRVIR